MAIYKINERKKVTEPLTEATSPEDYRVVSVTMDIAMPADRSFDSYGTDSSRGNAGLYYILSGALESAGLRMAGDSIDVEVDRTDIYRDNGYEFFGEE